MWALLRRYGPKRFRPYRIRIKSKPEHAVVLLIFLAIKLQSEILDLYTKKNQDKEYLDKLKESKNENIILNDKIIQLREQNKILENENNLINKDITLIQNQIDIITSLIKKIYEE